jgi:flagellin-specific chaperone FliS
MPIDLLPCNASTTTAIEATKAKTASAQLRSVRNLLTELNEINSHAHDGSDFSLIEALYGLAATPLVEPNKSNGQVFVELIDGALKAINGVETNAQCVALTQRVV